MANKKQKKAQAAALKKRRKQKVRAARQQKQRLFSQPKAMLRRAAQLPLAGCWINADWESERAQGLIRITVAREQPDGLFTWASYLVDTYLLGVKDAMANVDFTPEDFEEEVLPEIYFDVDAEECPPELAHQLIYQAIDYAAQYDFKPCREFNLARHVLEPRGTLDESHDLEFGMDGKPLFVAGPHDKVDVILRKLDKNPGQGNYDYVLPVPSLFGDDEDWLDADLEDDFEDDEPDDAD